MDMLGRLLFLPIVFFAHPGVVPGNEIPPEVVDAWKQADQRTDIGSFSVETRVVMPGKNRLRRSEFSYARIDGQMVQTVRTDVGDVDTGDETIDLAFGDDGSFRWLSDFLSFASEPPKQKPQRRVLTRLRLIDLAFRIEHPKRAELIAK